MSNRRAAIFAKAVDLYVDATDLNGIAWKQRNEYAAMAYGLAREVVRLSEDHDDTAHAAILIAYRCAIWCGWRAEIETVRQSIMANMDKIPQKKARPLQTALASAVWLEKQIEDRKASARPLPRVVLSQDTTMKKQEPLKKLAMCAVPKDILQSLTGIPQRNNPPKTIPPQVVGTPIYRAYELASEGLIIRRSFLRNVFSTPEDQREKMHEETDGSAYRLFLDADKIAEGTKDRHVIASRIQWLFQAWTIADERGQKDEAKRIHDLMIDLSR